MKRLCSWMRFCRMRMNAMSRKMPLSALSEALIAGQTWTRVTSAMLPHAAAIAPRERIARFAAERRGDLRHVRHRSVHAHTRNGMGVGADEALEQLGTDVDRAGLREGKKESLLAGEAVDHRRRFAGQ